MATSVINEVVCSCPSGDGSLRFPCPVHPMALPSLDAAGQMHRCGLWIAAPAFDALGYRLHVIKNSAFAIIPRNGNSQYRQGWNDCCTQLAAAVSARAF